MNTSEKKQHSRKGSYKVVDGLSNCTKTRYEMTSQGWRPCGFDSRSSHLSKHTHMKYFIWNDTDGIPGPAPDPFDTKEEAETWLTTWCTNLKERQGYYSTAERVRLDPFDVEFVIRPINDES